MGELGAPWGKAAGIRSGGWENEDLDVLMSFCSKRSFWALRLASCVKFTWAIEVDLTVGFMSPKGGYLGFSQSGKQKVGFPEGTSGYTMHSESSGECQSGSRTLKRMGSG